MVSGLHREIFSSIPDQVIVVRLTADKPASLNFTIGATCPHAVSDVITKDNDLLVITGTTSDHEGVKSKVHFASFVKAVPEGGTMNSDGKGH